MGSDGAASPARGRVLSALAAVILTALVVSFFWWREVDERAELLEASAAADEAARSAVSQMLTYDYRTLDEDFAWVAVDGTPTFATNFAASVESVREIAESTSATSEAEILQSGVQVVDDEAATVLVAADSAISQPTRAAPILERWRISVSLVREDGRWLIDEITLL